jgi:hypothetical protein
MGVMAIAFTYGRYVRSKRWWVAKRIFLRLPNRNTIQKPLLKVAPFHPSGWGAWQLIRFGKMDAGPSRAAGQRQSSFLSLPIATNFHSAAILLTQSLRTDYFSNSELRKVI